MYRVTITLVTKTQSKMFSISFINKIEIIHPQFASVPLGCSAWLVRQNKKNMCFRLPTVPKFRSPTDFFVIFGFLQLILTEKGFCFCNVRALQTTRQPRSNCWPMKVKEQRAVAPRGRLKNVDFPVLFL